MNKIYKVVWSKVKNSYVVVSEVAKANGKSGVRSIAAVTAAAILMSGGTAVLTQSAAEAADSYTVKGMEYTSVDQFKDENGFAALGGGKKAYCNYYVPFISEESEESNEVTTNGPITYETKEGSGSFGIFAAYSGNRNEDNNYKENPNGNTLKIEHNITVNTQGQVHLYGAGIDVGADGKYESTAKNNSVLIGTDDDDKQITVKSGGTVFIGGALGNSGSKSVVDSNTAIVKNVTFDVPNGMVSIYGGANRDGSANNNSVEVKNISGTVNIYGGIADGATGNADKNTVSINGGSIAGAVYGGYAQNGTASGNVINVSGDTDISNASLYGDNDGEGTGNTLNLTEGWTGKTVGLAENFNEINVEKGVEADFTQGIKATEDLVVNAQNATVTIAGNADDGVKAVVYAAEGASLTINATNAAGESLAIKNEGTASTGAAVLAVGAVNETKVALDGNIDIDANGGRGVKAQNDNNSTDTSATIDLGGDTTESITVKNAFIGLGAHYNGSRINVAGDALTIEDVTGYGIYAMNGTSEDADPSDNAQISIGADTVTTVIMAEGGYGAIAAQSQGSIEIAGDLYVEAETAVTARGNANVKINEDNDASKTVQLIGDVDFAYDKQTSGTPVEAAVIINLANEQSSLTGNIFVSGDDIPADYDKVTGMNLGLANGAQWTTKDSGTSFVNNLTMDGGIINQNSTGDITIDNLTGEGNVVFRENSGQINVMAAEAGSRLNLSMAGTDADSFNTIEDLDKVAIKLDVAEEATKNLTGNVHVDEGLINGAIDMTVEYQERDNGKDNLLNGIIKDVQHSASTTALNISNAATNAAVAWRDEDATLSQRLGELRESEGSQGVWARMTQGEFERGSDFETEYNTLQIGYDKAKDDWHYGAAVSHSEGDTVYGAGSGEIDSTSLSVYGTWQGDKGHYKDIVAKIGVINNEYTINAANQLTKGDYDTTGTSLSAEYGMKQNIGSGWYINPLAKMTYMHIGSADYTTNNSINVKHKSVDSLIARLGAELGKQISEKGDIYIKASALHDFGGDADTILKRGDNSAFINDEIGGTWYEIGLGFNYKTSDATYLYADVIKTYGDEIRTPWQWNAGVRYSF